MNETTDDAPLGHVRDGALAVLTLNRPTRFNCLSRGLLDALDRALATIADDPATRAVLIRGAGKHFCTGADLDEVLAARDDPAAMRAFVERGHAVFRHLEQLAKPTVAAVQGLALAGGLELLLCCDLVVMGRSARIGDQHARYGLHPAWGSSVRLPRLVGRRRALDLLYSARWLDAAEALSWGLVNEVVDDDALDAGARGLATRLAGGNPDANAFVKAMSEFALDNDLDGALARESAGAAAGLMSTNTGRGLAAFQAREEPRFE
ncbi:MAG: enoyl-CoA hydratase/isomerase family protein [Gammaproteobacteria bacterium]|nr:enoyl-CoA hydratase/isomerase family protein [Gammaproteobacteria bacterium]